MTYIAALIDIWMVYVCEETQLLKVDSEHTMTDDKCCTKHKSRFTHSHISLQSVLSTTA